MFPSRFVCTSVPMAKAYRPFFFFFIINVIVFLDEPRAKICQTKDTVS